MVRGRGDLRVGGSVASGGEPINDARAQELSLTTHVFPLECPGGRRRERDVLLRARERRRRRRNLPRHRLLQRLRGLRLVHLLLLRLLLLLRRWLMPLWLLVMMRWWRRLLVLEEVRGWTLRRRRRRLTLLVHRGWRGRRRAVRSTKTCSDKHSFSSVSRSISDMINEGVTRRRSWLRHRQGWRRRLPAEKVALLLFLWWRRRRLTWRSPVLVWRRRQRSPRIGRRRG